MNYRISGIINKNGTGTASKRFKKCHEILNSYDIKFPPFEYGTLNVELEKEFSTPNWSNIIFVPEEELEKYDLGWKEWWELIPAEVKTNGEKIPAFILRTKINYHQNKVAELVAHKIDLPDKSKIEILLSDK